MLLRNAHGVIPSVTLAQPLSAWELARTWPDAHLVVVHDSGHTGSDAMRQEVRAALERFGGG